MWTLMENLQDCLDLFFVGPEDDSGELKHVAQR